MSAPICLNYLPTCVWTGVKFKTSIDKTHPHFQPYFPPQLTTLTNSYPEHRNICTEVKMILKFIQQKMRKWWLWLFTPGFGSLNHRVQAYKNLTDEQKRRWISLAHQNHADEENYKVERTAQQNIARQGLEIWIKRRVLPIFPLSLHLENSHIVEQHKQRHIVGNNTEIEKGTQSQTLCLAHKNTAK